MLLELIEGLKNNSLEADFIADFQLEEGFERVNVFEEELVIVAPFSHQPIDTPKDIKCSTVLAFQEGGSYRSSLLNWYKDHQVQPAQVAIMSSYPAILASVAAGMGIGIVPLSLIEDFKYRESISIQKVKQIRNVTTNSFGKKDEIL